jgi:hypothetical protein
MYASFKGVVGLKNITFEAKKMIAEVGLMEKINAKSSTLSGLYFFIYLFLVIYIIYF